MQAVRWKVLEALRLLPLSSPPPSSHSIATLARATPTCYGSQSRASLASPWAAIQSRGAKMLGSDVRVGDIVQRKGRVYQVLKAQHTQKGRGGATIQVELRDADSGNKIVERFRTDEALETVVVEDKTFTYLYQEGDSVMLMEPTTFEQLEIPKEFFGKASIYLKDDMQVTIQYYDGRPMSASIPSRVTCRVVEAPPHTKGLTAAPQYKKVVLDNGLTVMAPPFIEVGEDVVIKTADDTYITRQAINMI